MVAQSIHANDGQRAEAATSVTLERIICLAIAIVLTLVSVASYYQASFIKEMWPWQDQAMTYRFAAAYLFAFAGSLFWVAITGEMAGLFGIALTVIVNAIGMLVFLSVYATRHDGSGLGPNIIAMGLVLVGGVFALFWSRARVPMFTIRTPGMLRVPMFVFPVILFIASTRLILQQTNVFPWDPQPQFSTIIGLCLMGSVFYFLFGAVNGNWTHAGGQFAGFLAYDLVLLPPYLKMLRADDAVASTSASGFATYASTVNNGPLYIFLTAIILSLVLSVWYLFIEQRTRMFRRQRQG